jgi:predicted transcriptional regulator of viral defense system
MARSRSSPATRPINHAKRLFEQAGGTLRAGQARAAGVHPRTLAAMVQEGVLERVSRGLYRLADAAPLSDPDLAVAAFKAPSAIVCLISALAFHELTTQIPHRVDLALPPGARTPKLDHPPIQVYRFSGRSMTEGVDVHEIGGTSVRIFSAPKTVADCFKFRNRIGADVAVEALRAYLRHRGSRVDDLLRFADIDRVRRVMTPYLEATL